MVAQSIGAKCSSKNSEYVFNLVSGLTIIMLFLQQLLRQHLYNFNK